MSDSTTLPVFIRWDSGEVARLIHRDGFSITDAATSDCAQLMNLNEHARSAEEASKMIDSEGYRPGTFAELLLWGEKNPVKKTEHIILALGSVVMSPPSDPGEKVFASAYWTVDSLKNGKRSLVTQLCRYGWLKGTSCLVVRKLRF